MKKLIIAAAAVFLCGCGTDKDMVETDYIESEPTESVISEITYQTEAKPSGIDYTPNQKHLTIDMDNLASADSLEEYSDITSLSIYNVGEHDIGFIGQFQKLEHISFRGCNGTEGIINAVNNAGLTLRSMYVNADSFSEADGDALFTAFPSTETVYMQNSDEWNSPTHKEGLKFYVSPNVGDPYENYPLSLNFYNNTRESGYVSEIQLFYNENDSPVPAEIINGSSVIEMNMELMAGESAEYSVPVDIIDIQNTPVGRYTAVCSMKAEDEEEYSEITSEFFIHSKPFTKEFPDSFFENGDISDPNTNGTSYYLHKSPDFLDEEQQKTFDLAYRLENIYFGTEREISEQYAREHTADEFITDLTKAFTYDRIYEKTAQLYFDENGNIIPVSAGGGVDLTFMDMEFFPIYLKEDEVLFKAEIIHGHEDDPYFVWFSERNFHMQRTEDGWRFDCFNLWY
ncbi:MAG: hypothetical protein MSJ26_05310 [Oscillospiraceae bacterium]|nr:hypothetical protein [Oscillospiraceae bacterium]